MLFELLSIVSCVLAISSSSDSSVPNDHASGSDIVTASSSFYQSIVMSSVTVIEPSSTPEVTPGKTMTTEPFSSSAVKTPGLSSTSHWLGARLGKNPGLATYVSFQEVSEMSTYISFQTETGFSQATSAPVSKSTPLLAVNPTFPPVAFPNPPGPNQNSIGGDSQPHQTPTPTGTTIAFSSVSGFAPPVTVVPGNEPGAVATSNRHSETAPTAPTVPGVPNNNAQQSIATDSTHSDSAEPTNEPILSSQSAPYIGNATSVVLTGSSSSSMKTWANAAILGIVCCVVSAL